MGSFKAIICWTATFGVFVVQVTLYTNCGLEHCHGEEGWDAFMDFTELICQSGLVVVLASMLWELVRALKECKVKAYFATTFFSDNDGLAVTLIGFAFSFLTMTCLFWRIWNKASAPFSIQLYAYIADLFCHAFIASAVVGIIYDFLMAVKQSRAGAFLWSFATCQDDVEGHGADLEKFGTDQRVELEPEAAEPVDWCKASVMWVLFLTSVILNKLHGNHLDVGADWVSKVLGSLGSLCAGGLSCALVCALFHVEKGAGTVIQHSMKSKSIMNLVNKHKSEPAGARELQEGYIKISN
jgi:hypothetical protein